MVYYDRAVDYTSLRIKLEQKQEKERLKLPDEDARRELDNWDGSLDYPAPAQAEPHKTTVGDYVSHPAAAAGPDRPVGQSKSSNREEVDPAIYCNAAVESNGGGGGDTGSHVSSDGDELAELMRDIIEAEAGEQLA